MHNRSTALTLLLAALLVLVASASPAWAHRLIAEYTVLPGRKIQVDSWFDLTALPPRQAKVEVFRVNGDLLTHGVLDDQGIFVFNFSRAEQLRVVVSAGAGHRAEIVIPPEKLVESSGTEAKAPTSALRLDNSSSKRAPLVDRRPRVSIKDVLIGVGFLLAVAAFVLSMRNARQLRSLAQAKEPPISAAEK